MKKILACVDGSDLSAPVLRQAFALAEANRAEGVEVFHVVDRDVEFSDISAGSEDAAERIGRAVQEKIEGLTGSVIDLAASKIPFRINVAVGSPYKTIVKRVRENGVDLVVMGHRGLKGMKRFYLGSVAAKVVAYATCHVLVLRSETAETRGKVLVAVDGSEESPGVMGFGLDYALKAGAGEVLFFSVVEEVTEIPYVHGGAFDAVTDTPEFRENAVRGARERLEGMLEKLKDTRDTSGMVLRTEVELGHTHATIIGKAEKEGSDLIVVGDRGKSGLEGFLLGSISAKIVRYAPCGVLVCRTGKERG